MTEEKWGFLQFAFTFLRLSALADCKLNKLASEALSLALFFGLISSQKRVTRSELREKSRTLFFFCKNKFYKGKNKWRSGLK